MQKRSNYDKIDYKNNTIYTNYIFIRKKLNGYYSMVGLEELK